MAAKGTHLTPNDVWACQLLTKYGRIGLDRHSTRQLLIDRAAGGDFPIEWANDDSNQREECIEKMIMIGIVSDE